LRARVGAAAIRSQLQALIGAENVITADSEDELAAAIGDAELLLIPDAFYSVAAAKLLRERAKKLKWIQLLSAGYDAVIRNGIPPGIALTNAGDAYAPAVATHAIALLLGVQRQFPILLADQERHAWDEGGGRPRASIPFGSTVAVLGFGHIGSEIGRLLQAFNAHVIALTRSAQPYPYADESLPITQLHAVLPRLDAVVIAMAASEETRHLFGAPEFALMKKTAAIVNIARGYIIDGAALATALKDGTIGGAGIDVTEPEPLPANDPLWDAPNLILAPHMAGASGTVLASRLAQMVCDNVERYRKGETLANLITL
jgi:phosphoglycerate dehydrogenase-like enzyme